MGNKYLKASAIGLPIQLWQLKKTYGNLIVKSRIKGSVLFCEILLTPSAESNQYRILISYKLSDYAPRAYMIEPQIQMHDGKLPEHIYGFDKKDHPRLCVYYPNANEWNRQMLIATSYVPWILTWLNTYEYWLITGEWFYPAISHGKKSK